VCRSYDPYREHMYRNVGLRTISPTKIGAPLKREALEADGEPVAVTETAPSPGATP
jgi:hypothetical protein